MKNDGTDAILAVAGLSKRFGGLQAVSDVSFDLFPGQVLGLIGPNGAGKSTVINLITGYETPDSGSVVLGGERINGSAPHRLSQLGLRRTFQTPRVFKRLSVRDNITLAEVGTGRGTAYNAPVLAALGGDAVIDLPASSLPMAGRRLVELARACTGTVKAVLLDEPSTGLVDDEKTVMKSVIRAVAAEGVAVLVVAHDIQFVLDICERIVVLAMGAKLAEGEPGEIIRNPAVVEAYLGAGWDQHA